MDRGFLSGLAAGLVLVVGGGVVVSELAPPVKLVVVPAASTEPASDTQVGDTGEGAASASGESALDAASPAVEAAPDPAQQGQTAEDATSLVAPTTAANPDTAAAESGATKAPDAAPAATEPENTAAPAVTAGTPETPQTPVQEAEPAAPDPDLATSPTIDPPKVAQQAPAADPLAQVEAAPSAAVQPAVTDEAAALAKPGVAAEVELPAVAEPAALTAAPAIEALQAAQAAPAVDAAATAEAAVPQPPVEDQAAELARVAAEGDESLPAAAPQDGVAAAAPPVRVEQPAADALALNDPATPAANPAVISDLGAVQEPAANAAQSGTKALSELAADVGAAAAAPAQPAADAAIAAIPDPAPLPEEGAASEAEPAAVDPEVEPSADQPQATTVAEPETGQGTKPAILTRIDPGMPKGTNAPEPGFANGSSAVKILRPDTRVPEADPDSDATTTGAPGTPALVRNAADFTNPDGKPLMSVILIDDGAVEPARIIGLGFPVTVALDPVRAGAAEAAETYRRAGLEVLILATSLPEGATASDLEVTFQSHFNTLPQAVGVMDLPLAGFQDNRVIAQQVVGLLGDGGYGLVTIDKGLNPAAQVAERERLPQARVFREVDAAGEDDLEIRRYLDRAAFRGAQQGSVTVLGHASDKTLQALVSWAAEGRAANMALSPISAVMSGI